MRQVAAFSASSQKGTTDYRQQSKRRCFNCNRVRHLQRECPFYRQGFAGRLCCPIGQPGHNARQCPENNRDVPVKETRCPSFRIGPSTRNADILTVATINSKLEVIPGKRDGVVAEIMLHSGSSVSLVKQEILSRASGWTFLNAPQPLPLITACGENLRIVICIRAPIRISELDMMHDFVVA